MVFWDIRRLDVLADADEMRILRAALSDIDKATTSAPAITAAGYPR
jgi:hypothetical protein